MGTEEEEEEEEEEDGVVCRTLDTLSWRFALIKTTMIIIEHNIRHENIPFRVRILAFGRVVSRTYNKCRSI